jgi:hypothetical protein
MYEREKKRFYAANGSNAVAVFDSWEEAEYCQKYFSSFRNKKFKTFGEAESHALGVCLRVFFPSDRLAPKSLTCNEIIFFKNCPKLVPLLTDLSKSKPSNIAPPVDPDKPYYYSMEQFAASLGLPAE